MTTGTIAAGALQGVAAKLIHAGQWAGCRLAEISPTGALFEVDHDIVVGEKVVACIAEVGALAGVVAESGGGRCAVQFAARAPGAALAYARA